MKDTLFQVQDGRTPFQFDSATAAVFDDMAERSIPGYRAGIDLILRLTRHMTRSNDLVYDLGCSTATVALTLAAAPWASHLRIVGIDTSAAMVDQAQAKVQAWGFEDRVQIALADITEFPLEPCRIVVLAYTLQFVEPDRRPALLDKIAKALLPGGGLIVLEKLLTDDPAGRLMIQAHEDFKRHMGYTDTEIARKRQALEHVLIPYSESRNRSLLTEAGFSQVECIHRALNFAGFLALMPS